MARHVFAVRDFSVSFLSLGFLLAPAVFFDRALGSGFFAEPEDRFVCYRSGVADSKRLPGYLPSFVVMFLRELGSVYHFRHRSYLSVAAF